MDKKLIFIAQGIRFYKPFFNRLKKEGFLIIPIELKWRSNLVSDWINITKKKISQISFDKDTIISGHSIGASIALILSTEVKFNKAIIISPSPVFKESLVLLNNSERRYFGKKRIEDVEKNIILKNLSKKIKTSNIVLYVGSDEHKIMKKNINKIEKYFKSSKIVTLHGKNHINLLEDVNII